MENKSLLKRFLVWRLKHLNHKQFIYILSIIIGLISGIIAVIIKNSVFFIEEFLTTGIRINWNDYLCFFYPLIGIALVYLFLKYILKKPGNRGFVSILYSISKRNSIMRWHQMFSPIISSALTVGFGGSVGLEAPTAVSGSAIGSRLSKLFHLNYKSKTLLIGCAVAGTIAAIFKAPIAAIIFAIEVIMLDLTMASLIPLLLASVSAVMTSRFFLGEELLLPVSIQGGFALNDLLLYVGLGLLAGFTSVYFYHCYTFVTTKFKRIKKRFWKIILGGSILSILIYLFPPLFGEGYEFINKLTSGNSADIVENNQNLLLFLIGLFLLKVIATSATIGAGGVGGIFAPVLFMGASLGVIFSKSLAFLGLNNLSESHFALVGMAALMAGVMHAPLTAIFLIAEITSGYQLFIPLMISSSIAYITSTYFVPHSVFTMQLAKRGDLVTHHKDKAILSRIKLEKIIEKDLSIVNPSMILGEFVKIVANSKRNIFPVVDSENTFLGIVAMDDVRGIMFDQSLYQSETVTSMMRAPLGVLSTHNTMEEVTAIFKDTGAWNLPVLKKGKYVGYISKSKLFSVYRRRLLEVSED